MHNAPQPTHFTDNAYSISLPLTASCTKLHNLLTSLDSLPTSLDLTNAHHHIAPSGSLWYRSWERLGADHLAFGVRPTDAAEVGPVCMHAGFCLHLHMQARGFIYFSSIEMLIAMRYIVYYVLGRKAHPLHSSSCGLAFVCLTCTALTAHLHCCFQAYGFTSKLDPDVHNSLSHRTCN